MKNFLLKWINNRIVNGGLWTFIGKAIVAFSALLSNILLSRLLDTSDFGAYMLAFNIAFFGSIIGILGLNQSIIRFTTENLKRKQYSQTRKAVQMSLLIAFSGAIGTIAIFIALQHFVLSRFMDSMLLNSLSILIGLWIIVNIFQQFIGETFRGLGEVKLASWFGGVFGNLLYIGTLVVFLLAGYKGMLLSEVILMVGLSLLLNCVLGGWILHLKLKKLSQRDTETSSEMETISATSILRVSLPMMLSNVAIFLLISTDLWILGIFQNEEQVALYGSAVRLIATINFFGVLLNLMMSTVISEKHAFGQLKELEKIGKIATTIVTLPTILLVIIFALAGEQILGIMFGSSYSQADSILLVLSIGQVINLIVGPSGLVLTLTGHERTMLKITIFTSCLTMAAACLAAKFASPFEVSLAMVIGLTLQNALMFYNVKRKLGIMIYFNPLLIWKAVQLGWRLIRSKFKRNLGRQL